MTASGTGRGRGLARGRHRVRGWVWAALVAAITALGPWTAARADDGWAAGRQFGLSEATAEGGATATVPPRLVAALSPGSVLVAQAGTTGAETSAEGWRFTLAPYLWAPRTKMTVDIGRASQSTTIDFVDVIPQLHFAFAAHAEASRREWTGFLDLMYMSMGQSETQNGVSTSINLQELFFEFGATYRLPALSLGRAGRLTLEPLVGGRFYWV